MAKHSVNGIDIHYQIDGDVSDRPIMCSNSLASNLNMWDLQIEHLLAQGFGIIRYDSRGHGQSEAPKGPYSIEMLADDAAGLLTTLGIQHVHFCGLSKGGMVAQMMGVRHPDRVKSLIIADSAAFMPAKDTWEQRIQAVTAGGMEAVVDATLERWITSEGRDRLPDQVELIRRMILNTPVQGFVACSEAIKSMDMRPGNPKITAPTLVICGKQDTGTTPQQAEEIAEAVPNAELELIDNAAHLANIEQHEVFNSLLSKFLAKVGG
ncbi:MAG: 3-oxoadipate enol-lactonase [Pelagibacterales bacterium]|nr:3-oxoadipate enol-lactonase [Pelagibacterales bacterium]